MESGWRAGGEREEGRRRGGAAGAQQKVEHAPAATSQGEQRVDVLDIPRRLLRGVLAALVRVDAGAEGADGARLAQPAQRADAARPKHLQVVAAGHGALLKGGGAGAARRARLEVVDHERVDAAQPRALQRVLQLPLQRRCRVVVQWREVVASEPANTLAVASLRVGHQVAPDLCLQHERVARQPVQRQPEARFAEADAVPRRRVEEGDARLVRRLEGRQGLAVRDARVQVAEGCTAHAKHRHLQARLAAQAACDGVGAAVRRRRHSG